MIFVSKFVSDISIFMYKWQDLTGALLGVVASFVVAIFTLFVQRWIDRENLKKQFRPVLVLHFLFVENDFKKESNALVIDENKEHLCPIEVMNVSDNLASIIVMKVNYEYKGKFYSVDCSDHLIPVINGMTTYSSVYLWNIGVSRSSGDSEPEESDYKLNYIKNSKDPIMSVTEFFKLVKINNIILTLTTSQFERLQYTFLIDQNMYDLFCTYRRDYYYNQVEISKGKEVS